MSPYAKKAHFALRILSLLMVLSFITGTSLFYAFLILSTILVYRGVRQIRVSSLILIYLFIALCSVLFNNAEGAVYGRFLSFVCIVVTFGPVCSNAIIDERRWAFLQTIMVGFFCTVFASVLLMLLGVIPLVNPNETAGGFAGLFENSMTLAPVVAVSAFGCIYNIIHKSKYWPLNFFVLFVCFLVMLACGSRSCLAAFFIAVTIFLWQKYRNRMKAFIGRYVLPLFLFLLLIVMVSGVNIAELPILDVIEKKQEIQEATEGNSRERKWGNRLKEFEQSPILGVGIFCVDERISRSDISDNGTIEYGSSWMALLSTTGLLGFLFMTCFYIKVVFSLWKKSKQDDRANFLLMMLIFFGLHLIFEGYLFSARNMLTVFFWCLLSCCSSYERKTVGLNYKFNSPMAS